MKNTIPISIKPAGATALLPRGSAALFASLLALPVWAHHPMDGAVPTSAWEGLLSGLAHPVLGLDHLAFLIAAALLAAWSGVSRWRGASLVLAFVGTRPSRTPDHRCAECSDQARCDDGGAFCLRG